MRRRAPTTQAPRRALWPFLRRQWPALAGSALTTALVAGADLAQPWPLKLTLDRILGAHPTRPFVLQMDDLWALAGVVALLLTIALVDALAELLRRYELPIPG